MWNLDGDDPLSEFTSQITIVGVSTYPEERAGDTYRGRQIPVYDAPEGMGLIDKLRGEARWTVWLFAKPHFISDVLALLGRARTSMSKYTSAKKARSRWFAR